MIKKYILLLSFLLSFASFAQVGPNCPLVCYGPGGSVSNSSLTITSNTYYSNITISNGRTLIIRSGFTLYVGLVGTNPTTQVVDFNNGCTVIIEPGASLVVNGRLNNSNNSNGVSINGSVVVSGNVTAGNGSVIAGTGTLQTTGTITNSGTIFNSGASCSSGPCFTTPTCPTSAGTLSGNQYICNYGSTTATLLSSTVLGGTWSSSNVAIATVHSSTGVVTAVGAGTATITYSIGGGSCTVYNVTRDVFVTNGPGAAPTGLTGSNSQCQNTSTTYSINAVTGSYAYNWSYSGTGATITPAANGLSASVSFNSAATSGNMQVTSTNACGTSGPSILTVAVSPAISGTPVANAASNIQCDYVLLNFSTGSNITGVFLDIARDNGFTNLLTAYTNYQVNYNNGSIPVSNLPAGTLYYRIRGYNNCGVTANSNTVSFITTRPIGGSVSSSQSICMGATPANLTLTGYSTTNTGILTWQKSSDAAFTSPIDIVGTSPTLLGSTIGSLTSNTYFRAIVRNQFGSWCETPSGAVLITVTAVTPTPIVSSAVQPTCTTSTGSVLLSGLPSSGFVYQTDSTETSVYSITGTSMTITGIEVGSYTFLATNGTCVSAPTSVVVINPAVIPVNNYNGSWDNGIPNSNQKLVFNSLYNSTTANLDGCSCEVNPGVTVNINTGLTLNLINELTVAPTATMTFFDDASLVQKNNVVNVGEIYYNRSTKTAVRATDYVYWSSPVLGQDIGNLSTKTNNGSYYSYNSSTEYWDAVSSGTSMGAGIGYIVRSPDFISGLPVVPGLYTATFIGRPNNGTLQLPVTYTNPLGLTSSDPDFGVSYLLGNPYPSALDAEAFLDYNSGVLGGTIYFWTHNTALDLAANITNPGAGWAYTYSLNDYAAYNSLGGVAVGSGVSALTGGAVPTGKIAAGQGFFATGIATGTLEFNNGMRVTGNNSQFFKIRNSPKTIKQAAEKSRIWLNLTNTQGAFKQTLVGYITNATNQYDIRFDGESYDGNEFIDFYSVNQDKNLTIQGRALPFDDKDTVNLGYRSTIEGDFTINIDNIDGLLVDKNVFIEDKLTNTTFDLKKGNYTFTTVPGVFNDRFVLRYINNKTLGTDQLSLKENQVLVSVVNKQIIINSFAETIDKIAVYDLLGRSIFQKVKVNSNDLTIDNLGSSPQTLIVKTTLQNGRTQTDKVIY